MNRIPAFHWQERVAVQGADALDAAPVSGPLPFIPAAGVPASGHLPSQQFQSRHGDREWRGNAEADSVSFGRQHRYPDIASDHDLFTATS
jgi:hypothetical protein